MREALGKAIEAAGGQSAFARAIGVTQQAVSWWWTKTGQIPAQYVLTAEKATGVSRHDLRPDLYPREEAAA